MASTTPNVAAVTNFVAGFSEWFPWARRLEIPDGRSSRAAVHGGVYLLAHFSPSVPAGAANHLDDNVFYVGESNDLRGRWYKFERSANKGLSGHSGGHSYRGWSVSHPHKRWEDVNVAAMPIHFDIEGHSDEPHSLARRFRLFTEQRVLWELIQHRRSLGVPLHLLNEK